MTQEKFHFQKVALLVIGIFYPLWGVLFEHFLPGAEDPLFLRILGSFLILGVLILFHFNILTNRALLDQLFVFLLCAIVLHTFYLVSVNTYSSLYRIQALTTVSALSTTLTSQKQLKLFAGWVGLLSVILLFRPYADPTTLYVFSLANATILTVSWFSRPSRVWSINKLEARTNEVKALYEQQTHFIGALSHDLRTPLVPLVALLPKLAMSAQDEKTKKMFELAIRNVAYLKRLIENSLTYSYLSSGAMNFSLTSFNLSELVEETWGVLNAGETSQFNFKNLVSENVLVVADRQRIEEVLLNLFTNAIRHTPKGGTITVDAQDQGESILVSVTDTGVGMTPQDLKKVFAVYYKADGSRGDQFSVGLGLSICRSIIEKHGYTIYAESPGLNQGAKILFSIKKSGDYHLREKEGVL